MKILAILLVLFAFVSTPPITSAATIKINEFYAAGSTSSHPDWVEVYNEGFDISLYQLIDAANNKKDLANSSCSGNFCTIDWYNSLNNAGDTIKLVLKTSPDTSIDEVTYPTNIAIPSSGQSAGRNPDGTGGWVIFSTPTKGSANSASISTPSPTPTPTPSPSPTPTPTPTPSPTSSSSTSSSFTISNIPSQISSDQSFTISVSLSLFSSPNTTFYLKGAFKKADGSNYFGLTKVSGNWVKNGSSFANQYVITTDSSGNWSGNLEVQPDAEDAGFTGTGDYIFKVARYTSTGSGPTWSNEFMINIVSTGSSDQGGTVLSTTSNNSSSTINPSPSPSVKGKTTTSSQSKSYDKEVYHTASAAAATASANPSSTVEELVKSQKQINFFAILGTIFVIAGIGLCGYIYFKYKNSKI